LEQRLGNFSTRLPAHFNSFSLNRFIQQKFESVKEIRAG
jgi:hypothetical protein